MKPQTIILGIWIQVAQIICLSEGVVADLDDSFRTKVKFDDGRFIPVTGKGRILITLKNGDHIHL